MGEPFELRVAGHRLKACRWGPQPVGALTLVLLHEGHRDGGSIALINAGSPRRAPQVRGLALLAPHVFCEALSVKSIAAAKDAFV